VRGADFGVFGVCVFGCKSRSVKCGFLDGFWRCLVLKTMPNPIGLTEGCVGFYVAFFEPVIFGY
jgi:hypothetical protein